MADKQYEEGKVYLRDKRNGNIHEYQDLLGGMSYMERFVYNAKEEASKTEYHPPVFVGTGADRAAEFDRLASLTNKDREAELKAKAAYDAEQAALREITDREVTGKLEAVEKAAKPSDAKVLTMTKKANGLSAAEYYENGWTEEQLIDQGFAKYK